MKFLDFWLYPKACTVSFSLTSQKKKNTLYSRETLDNVIFNFQIVRSGFPISARSGVRNSTYVE
jgi:hypothetical protein